MRRRSSGAKLPRMKTAQVPSSPLARRLGSALIVLACLAGASSALAQWQWRDANGRRIFSDSPPPASVADKDILQRPKGATPPPANAAAPSANLPSRSPMPVVTTLPRLRPSGLLSGKPRMDRSV